MITIDLKKAIRQLENEELVAIPTETVYGLAANAFSEKAIKKIYLLKERPFHNPLILHIKSNSYLEKVAIEIPTMALHLAEKFWPGPLTLVLKKNKSISDLITAGKETVAVRVPQHELTLALLNQINFPLVAPSANPFGSISPTCAKHVDNYFKNKLKIVLDGGECEKGLESTIIGFENNQPILYRHGAISIEEIEQEIGALKILAKNDQAPIAPGMLSKHYAPRTKMILTKDIKEILNNYTGKKIGILLYKNKILNQNNFKIEVLTEDGNLTEASRKLYAAMHRLDNSNLDIIITEEFPNEGLGKSINDRLKRAVKN